MGDRISIQFVKGTETSVTLFSHWDGKHLLAICEGYLRDLYNDTRVIDDHGPLSRLEPNTVMVDFIRHLSKNLPRILGNYYLGCTEADGDNSDNGHWFIDLDPKERSWSIATGGLTVFNRYSHLSITELWALCRELGRRARDAKNARLAAEQAAKIQDVYAEIKRRRKI